MDILLYLTELIKTRKEVGIPGIGTIYKRKTPGRYDVETHSFLPPSYILDFTTELREQTALIDFVTKKRNISLESATYYVNQFADELQKRFTDEQPADFGELGSLSVISGILTFTPSNNSNFGFDFYGLPNLKEEVNTEQGDILNKEDNDAILTPSDVSYDDAEIEEVPGTEEGAPQIEISEEQLNLENNNADLTDGSDDYDNLHPEDKNDEQQVYEEISEVEPDEKLQSSISVETQEESNEDLENTAAEETVPEGLAQNSDSPANSWNFDQASPLGSSEPQYNQDPLEDGEKKMPAYLIIIIAGGVVLAALIAVYFIKPNLFRGLIKGNTNNIANNETNKLKADSASYTDSVKRSTEKIISPAGSARDSSIVTGILPADSVTTWEVIGASVINQKEADWFITQMKNIGITAKVIPTIPGKRRIKISVATFYNETSAREGRKELVIKLKNPDLYIYQNKHTRKPE